jgi:signal transduction histidine kinase
VIKHARASRARVTVDIADGTIAAEIADDGIGGAAIAEGLACAISPNASTRSGAGSP